jgi:stage II sporulation protein P
VLIFHTHSSEAYTPEGVDRYVESDPYPDGGQKLQRDPRRGRADGAFRGRRLTVVHDSEIYDYPSYTGSYSRSGAAVERYLAQYPTIRVVIDLHRDALGGDGVGVQDAGGALRPEERAGDDARRHGENGLPASELDAESAPGALSPARDGKPLPRRSTPVELVRERYNQQLSPGMMILEVGSNGNTLREGADGDRAVRGHGRRGRSRRCADRRV